MSIDVERLSDGIVRVILNNVERRNLLTLSMFKDLAGIWSQLAEDAATRAVIVTGRGNVFCSGAEMSAVSQSSPDVDTLIDAAFMKTFALPMPVIAAINGDCIAGGLELALSADIRIAANEARLGFPEVRWGIMPSGGGSMKLADEIGRAPAMDLLLTGKLISAKQAERIGLVSSVVPAEFLEESAMEYAVRIAANSPVAVRATKRSAMGARMASYARRQREDIEAAVMVRASGDTQIGVEAFFAKRRPQFPDV